MSNQIPALTPEQHIYQARIERLKAVSYATVAMICILAIALLFSTACFFGFGFALGPLFGYMFAGPGGFAGVYELLVSLGIITAVAGPVISYYPIKFVGGYFFEECAHHWNKAAEHYKWAASPIN